MPNKERYQRELERNPDYNKKKNQRALELHPNYNKWLIKFKHKNIYLGYNPLDGKCVKCKMTVSSGKIKQTHLHHDIYDWNDVLANTRELCVSCHMKFHTGRPKIPEINKPETTYEMKLWGKTSWTKKYRT